jgi:hypothetical protein
VPPRSLGNQIKYRLLYLLDLFVAECAWAWKNWVQWHALAVVLAELTIHPQGERFNWAYSVATKSFEHYARIIADSESGMLWKPIAKLMRRVKRIKQGACSGALSNSLEYPTLLRDATGCQGEMTDLDTVHDRTMFDFSDWSLDTTVSIEPASLRDPTQPELEVTDKEDGARWLAWEDFLHDIDLLQA